MPPSWKTLYESLFGTNASTAAPPLVITFTICSYDLVFFTTFVASFLSSILSSATVALRFGESLAGGSTFLGLRPFLGVGAFFGDGTFFGVVTFFGVSTFFGYGVFGADFPFWALEVSFFFESLLLATGSVFLAATLAYLAFCLAGICSIKL